ncbi:MAG: YqgE/AlgH family protein [Chitinophagaceae bacterium]|nr:YqgE/AlgH family protein [Chitinophagaceae bacterium]
MVDPAAGILLIADPFLKDPNFIRTVILLCEHQQEGSLGFVINKQIEQTLDELISDLEGFKLPVYYGGPVQMNTIHFLHQYPQLIPDSVKVNNEIYWGGNFESVTALLKNNSIDPKKIKFFIGYSGWGYNQLNGELKEKSWLTVSASQALVFNTHYNEIWKNSLQKLGGQYKMMINYPIDPQLN